MTQWRTGLLYVLLLTTNCSAQAASAMPPTMARFRAKILGELLRDKSQGTLWTEMQSTEPKGLPVEVEEITRDWIRQYPERSEELKRDLKRLGELAGRRPMSWEENEEYSRRRKGVKATVVDHPWSTFDWALVFGERIARAEHDLAGELNVDEALIWQLTEHIIVRRPFALFETLRAPDFDRMPKPLYSTEMNERLASVIEPISTGYALGLRTLGRGSHLNRESVRVYLMPPRVTYDSESPAPIRFIFDRDRMPDEIRYSSGPLKVELLDVVVRLYAELLHNLKIMDQRLATLEESALATMAREEVQVLNLQIHTEVRTLPARYDAYLAERDRSSREQTWTESTWSSFDHGMVDGAAALGWARRIEAMAQGDQVVTSLAVNMLARLNEPRATCDALMGSGAGPVER